MDTLAPVMARIGDGGWRIVLLLPVLLTLVHANSFELELKNGAVVRINNVDGRHMVDHALIYPKYSQLLKDIEKAALVWDYIMDANGQEVSFQSAIGQAMKSAELKQGPLSQGRHNHRALHSRRVA